MTIKFYRERDEPYGCFSNFSHHPFTLDDHEWITVEHYFQAQKFPDTPLYLQIKDAPAPMAAKVLGNSREYPLRADWEQVKDGIMIEAVYQKFLAHKHIRTVLLSSGDEPIEEAARNDAYWGTGQDGLGRNQLGKTLMIVRDRLRKEGHG